MNMDIVTPIAMAAGLGWASGLRLYAVLFFIGVLGYFGLTAMPPDLAILSHPAVMLTTGALFAFEFGADKIPASTACGTRFRLSCAYRAARCSPAAAVADQSTALALAAGTSWRDFCRRRAFDQSQQPRANQYVARALQQLGGLARRRHARCGHGVVRVHPPGRANRHTHFAGSADYLATA
jgi:hypothetical protein